MDDLERKIYMGEEAKKFLSSPIGRKIIDTAESDEADAMQLLAVADPHNTKEIMNIQQDIRVSRAIPLWIQRTLADADVALTEYNESS